MSNKDILCFDFDDFLKSDYMIDDKLKIKISWYCDDRNILIFHLIGEINYYNVSLFQKLVDHVLSYGYYNLIFDCSNLNYISSSGVALILHTQTKLVHRYGRLVLCGTTDKVYSVFKSLNFDSFVVFTSSCEEAVTKIKDKQMFPKGL